MAATGEQPGMDAKLFWTKVRKTETCWIWMGTLDKDGYGNYYTGNRPHRAPRISYALAHPNQEIVGKVVRHTCDNPACVNPAHLRLGTQKDNMRDRGARGRTAKGAANGRAKISEEQVRELLRRANEGPTKLSKEVGLHLSTVANILKRKIWKHVSL